MFVYVPTYSGPYVVSWGEIKKEYMWWREEALVYHPALLISYGLIYTLDEALFRNFSDYMGYDLKKTLVIADSGGFEIYYRKEHIPVEDVLEWQFRHANIIVALDMPPRGLTRIEEMNDWEACKKFTKKNIEAMVRYASSRKAENRRIYGVVHGVGLGEINDWWRDVIKPFEGVLDGVMYSIRPPNSPRAMMLAMAHALENDVKNFHALAVTGTRTLFPAIYWEHRFNLITVDSASFTKMSGVGGSMYSPIFLDALSVGRKGKENTDYSKLTCHCPACVYARKHHLASIYNLHNVSAYFLAALHNLFWALSYVDGLRWLLAIDKRKFVKYALTSEHVDLEFMDCVDEKGLEHCYHTFPSKMVNEKGRTYMEYLEKRSTIKHRVVRKGWW